MLPKDFSWCEPYESPLNVELGQLPNVPLYVEKLSPDVLRGVGPRLREIWAAARRKFGPGSRERP